MEPARVDARVERTAVLERTAKEVKATSQGWHSYNGNIQVTAYVANLTDLGKQVSAVLKAFYEFNKKHPGQPLVAVPVSGWLSKVPTEGVGGFLSCFGTKEQAKRVSAEYGASYSLNPWISAPGADMILLTSLQAHYILPTKKKGEYKVSAGVQVTQFEAYLRKEGKAPIPTSTIHRTALSGGLGTGFYWPSKEEEPFSTHVVKAKVVDARGNRLKLSAKEKHHPHLFHALIHAHLGVFCVVELRIGGIVDNHLLKRTNRRYKSVPDLLERTKGTNPADSGSFMFQWFPYSTSNDPLGHQIRVTTIERTNEVPSDATKVRPYKISDTYKKLMETEAAEGIIGLITGHDKLRQFYPLVVRAAALDTFGIEEETVEVGDVGTIMHPFNTYTDQELSDINPCIQVRSTAEAWDLLKELITKVDEYYKKTGALRQFNIVSRVVKGIADPEGKRGIAPCLVDRPGEFILSFEVVEHEALSKTPESQKLRRIYLDVFKDRKFVLHHGKTPVEELDTLEKQFNRDELSKTRLQGFREAVKEVQGADVATSTLLTKNKIRYIFGTGEEEAAKERTLAAKQKEVEKPLDKECEKKVLQYVVDNAKDDPDLRDLAASLLK